MTGPAFRPGTVRWQVLAALDDTATQRQWSAPQIARRAELGVATVARALGWLRGEKLADLRVFIPDAQSLYQITPAGRQALAAGEQLQLGAPR